MAYRIRRKEPVQKGVRRIACEEIDQAIAEIEDRSLDRHEVVHQVRKRCKKLRGLLRLIRPVFDGYERENAAFRDAARSLAYVRDAQSIIECLDDLIAHYRDQIQTDRFATIRDELTDRRQSVADDQEGLEEKLAAFLEQMRSARRRAEHWKLEDKGFDAVAGGLKKTYGRGRKALRIAYGQPGTETFHEWRKRVKYHWYHDRLLRRIWPEMMEVQQDAGDELSDLLGDEHDLAVLRTTLIDDADAFGELRDRQALIGLIDSRRIELRATARPLGQRLFSEKPSSLAERYRGYWQVWRR